MERLPQKYVCGLKAYLPNIAVIESDTVTILRMALFVIVLFMARGRHYDGMM